LPMRKTAMHKFHFLRLFSKVSAFVQVGQNGATRTVILCVMFEETRFYEFGSLYSFSCGASLRLCR
jgi:hypothetical protein